MRCAHPTQPQYKFLFHSVHFAVSFLFPTKIMKKRGREVSFITKKTPPVPLFLYILHNFYGELPPFHLLKMKQKPFLSLFIYTHVINKTLLVRLLPASEQLLGIYTVPNAITDLLEGGYIVFFVIIILHSTLLPSQWSANKKNFLLITVLFIIVQL